MTFADDLTKPAVAGKKRRQRGAVSDDVVAATTFLVEAAEEEVVDLAEPDSLARHHTVASSAELAKRALRSDLLTPATAKRARLTSLSASTAFPTNIEGKLIINEGEC